MNIASEDEEGGEFEARVVSHIGSSHEQEPMFAYALGQARAERRELIARVEELAARKVREASK